MQLYTSVFLIATHYYISCLSDCMLFVHVDNAVRYFPVSAFNLIAISPIEWLFIMKFKKKSIFTDYLTF